MKTTFKYGLYNTSHEMPTRLPGGIHTGVELVSIRFEDLTSSNPTKVLRFTFMKQGMQFKYTELPIDEDNIATWKFKKSNFEETVARKFRELGERLKHIYTALTSEIKVDLEAASWEEFCNKFIALTGDKYKGKRYGIKVVYNDKGYTTFPERATNAFILPEEKSGQLKIDPQHDRISPPQSEANRTVISYNNSPPGLADQPLAEFDESISF